ncbi:MAG: BTAD domain-containing putative transcriptional regulator [Gemmatimonadota bacterium]
MLELRAFGSIDLRAEDGSLRSILTQPKRVGLLAYLALARPHGYQRRDTLLAMFWPEVDQTHARSALSQSLWFLRRALPPGVLVSRGTGEVGVDVEQTWCDVSAFEEAVAAGRWADALDLYRGELLGGFHVGRAPEFERWLDAERERLREMAAGAAWSLANARLEAGRLVEAERAAQRALLLMPTDESPVRAFVEALACAGDRAAALRFYRKFTDLLKDQLDIGPCPESVAVAEALRNGDTAAGAVAPAGPEPPETGENEALPSTEPAQAVKRRLHWLVGAIAAISALVIAYRLGTGPTSTTALGGSVHGVQATVAVLPFSVRGSDRLSYLRWRSVLRSSTMPSRR